MILELAISVVAVWIGVLLWFGRALYARWREPAFIQPIVIFESDDWGAGPVAQVQALQEIVALLSQHANVVGEHPVMTIGVILAAPAERTSGITGATESRLTLLTDDSQRAIRDALGEGAAREVFTLQLHGLTHFNEVALVAAAKSNPQLATWLAAAEPFWTELLPSELQSAWTDGSRLPSTDLPVSVLNAIAQREGMLWQELFGVSPSVGVPTTFVWTEQVESAWAAIGVQVLVTPGARYQGRGADGKPARSDKRILNGESGAAGIRYVVRNLYFEPSLGHSIDKLVDDITTRTRALRPSLVEMHRFNFCGPRAHPQALELLRGAVLRILAVMPEVRFMSTQRLAEIMVARDPAWIATAPRERLRAWSDRVREIPRFWKIARITGFLLPLWIFQRAIG